MKNRSYLVLALAAVLVFGFATVALAAGHSVYKGFSTTDAYLSWDGAVDLNAQIIAKEGGTAQTDSPHGGYTQTSVKCAVCHSIHRATSSVESSAALIAQGGGVGADWSLLGAQGGCLACHTAWGASPVDTLVEAGSVSKGPHFGGGCTARGCHGSVHGMGTQSEYATVARYNLANPMYNDLGAADGPTGYDVLDVRGAGGTLDQELDAMLLAGNYNGSGVPTLPVDARLADNESMKAYVTGYVCNDCHSLSSFSVAKAGFANYTAATADAVDPAELRTGHPSAAGQFYGHAPTCEKCHDLVGVATGTTAWPHGNRGIDVYNGRLAYTTTFASPVYADQAIVGTTTVTTTNSDATRYGLWMTASAYDADGVTEAITPQVYGAKLLDGTVTGGGFSLRDGVCMKCHDTVNADGTNTHALP